MSVLMRFGKSKAIFRAGRWISANLRLEAELNEATTRFIRETGQPALKDRDQEKTVARAIGQRFQGRMMLHMRSRNRQSEDHFHGQRQLEFDFAGSIPVRGRRASA